MRTGINRLFTCFISIFIIGMLSSNCFAADITETGTGTVSGNITINGIINPLTISVTHPLTVAYTIDPNDGVNGSFISPDILVKNNTKVPVKVTINSMKAATGGTLNFTDVLPEAKTWSSLNLADSKKYIALGILIKNSTGWNAGYNTSTMYAANEAASLFGVLPSSSTGSLALSANYGLAFDSDYTANHNLVFMFQLC